MSISEPIRVACRIRANSGGRSIVKASHPYVEILNPTNQQISLGGYKFNAVFDHQQTQAEVYEKAAKRVVDRVLGGFNGTIFAYGQTGSGKTHTIVGPSHLKELSEMEPTDRGIIPRSIDHLFDSLNVRKQELTEKSFNFEMKISYVQYYQDDWYDLLAANEKLRFSNTGGLVCSKFSVISSTVALKLVQLGWNSRRTAETAMNRMSSRSHCIFIVELRTEEMKGEGEERRVEERTSKLCLVDLAGSERVSHTGAQAGDKLFKETVTINKSLSHLSTVMMQLGQGQKHISYNNSELTKFLRDSLGGNAITSIVVTIHSDQRYLSTIENTLQFAKWCLNIKNEVQTNMKIGAETKLALQNEVNELNQKLQQAYVFVESKFESKLETQEEEIKELRKKYDLKDREVVMLETKLRLQTENFTAQSPRSTASPLLKRRRTSLGLNASKAKLVLNTTELNLTVIDQEKQSAFEEENERLKELLKTREKEIERLIEEKTELSQRIGHQAQEAKEKVFDLQNELDKGLEELKRQIECNEQLNKSKRETMLEHQDCLVERTRLEDEIEKMKENFEKLRERLRISDQEKESFVEKKAQELDEIKKNFESRLQLLEVEVEKKGRELAEQLERNRLLEKTKEQSSSNNNWLSSQREERIKRLEKDLEIANQQLGEFVYENQALAEQKAKITAEKSKLEKKCTALEAEAEDLRQTAERSQNALMKGREVTEKAFTEERENNRFLVQKLIAQHKEAFENEKKRQKQVETLQKQEIEKYQVLVKKITRDHAEQERKFTTEANKEIAFHKNRIKDLIDEGSVLKERIAQINKTIEELNEEKETQRGETLDPEIIRENRKQLDCLVKQIDLLERRLNEETKSRIETINECRRLEQRLTELKTSERKGENEKNFTIRTAAILQEQFEERMNSVSHLNVQRTDKTAKMKRENRLLHDALAMANRTLEKADLPTIKFAKSIGV